jgi:hypothetical protein
MDTVAHTSAHSDAEPDQSQPASSEAAATLCAFMGCETFAPFVLSCLTQAAREATVENAEVKARTDRTT